MRRARGTIDILECTNLRPHTEFLILSLVKHVSDPNEKLIFTSVFDGRLYDSENRCAQFTASRCTRYEEMQLQILCNPLIEFRTRQDSID